MKRVHCGWAAQAGVSAAQLVRHGITGPPTVLRGGSAVPGAAARGGPPRRWSTACERWSAPSIFFKPYPANHFTHTAIDAGMALRPAASPRPGKVDHPAGAGPGDRTIGESPEVKRVPQTGYQAQFSGPYMLVPAARRRRARRVHRRLHRRAGPRPAAAGTHGQGDRRLTPLRRDLSRSVPRDRHTAHHRRRGWWRGAANRAARAPAEPRELARKFHTTPPAGCPRGRGAGGRAGRALADDGDPRLLMRTLAEAVPADRQTT